MFHHSVKSSVGSLPMKLVKTVGENPYTWSLRSDCQSTQQMETPPCKSIYSHLLTRQSVIIAPRWHLPFLRPAAPQTATAKTARLLSPAPGPRPEKQWLERFSPGPAPRGWHESQVSAVKSFLLSSGSIHGVEALPWLWHVQKSMPQAPLLQLQGCNARRGELRGPQTAVYLSAPTSTQPPEQKCHSERSWPLSHSQPQSLGSALLSGEGSIL